MDLLRFSHCGKNIYTSSVDSAETGPGTICPLCLQPVSFGLLDAPVKLPCPFRDGHLTACCFLIGSERGSAFISEYSDAELHVGISNSNGVVFSYTESGVQRQLQGWEHCLVIPLVAPGDAGMSLRHWWNRRLEECISSDQWSPRRFYEERASGSCCYGFALDFINQVRRSEVKPPLSRDEFTSRYILPAMTTSCQYLSITQIINTNGYFATCDVRTRASLMATYTERWYHLMDPAYNLHPESFSTPG